MSLKEDLSNVIPPEELSKPGFYCDIIGDVAIISLPPGLDKYKERAAEAILSKRKNVRVVLNKLSKVRGSERVPVLEVLKGDDAIATYREYGFTYRFDVTRVFFNRHLSYERHRVAESAMPGETVLIPFAGVGPFAIPIAAKGCRVIAVEKSAEACRWMRLNARLNGVGDAVDIINGDALSIPDMLRLSADRVVIPTPYGMDNILERLALMVKESGMLHFYTFKKKSQIEGLIKQYEAMGLKVVLCRRCGNVAPGVSRWAFDLKKAL
ncbi:class I SAM-dependent methyltransferase [Methanocella conradii]|uniref:class I SAM-dependent methyltransferase n=1 Tax=Methanocella conradii TaxID=1175444 RepID=UPI0024B38213|nr:class I SAM-dependent methyltransferase family protein [Methanocella conradii]MDI6897956.1 class I SAM-dependent methyltransferase family protein [Methanocella conradii]